MAKSPVKQTLAPSAVQYSLGETTAPERPTEPHRTKPTVLYLFAGLQRKSDLGDLLRKRGWETTELDILRSASDDLSALDRREKLLREISTGKYTALVASPPCDTFSRVKFANNFGPKPCRTYEHLEGFPWLMGEKKRFARLGTVLAEFALDAAIAQCATSLGYYSSNSPRTWEQYRADRGKVLDQEVFGSLNK